MGVMTHNSGVTTLVAIPSETRGWLHRPRTADRLYTYKGEVHSKCVVIAPTTANRAITSFPLVRN